MNAILFRRFKRKKIIVLFSFIILLFMIQCEFPLKKDYIVIVSKPSETHRLALSLLNEGDTVRIFSQTAISYNLQTFGFGIYEADFSIGTQSWKVYDSTGIFYVEPNNYLPGIYSFSITLYSHDGTGSLADKIGASVYKAVRNWTFIIDNRPAPDTHPTLGITKDGFMKISWNKNPNYNFQNYQLSISLNNHRIEKTIHHADSCFYVDTLFAGGSITGSLISYASPSENSDF